ncbi:putative histidine-rich protein [Abeliophyllum distichum]|uniref:Histidine-rich protein n=1 Tax=Abeliophyllum distichum TaxID=126358 RepID=A0ABD1Q6C9_9LAMI
MDFFDAEGKHHHHPPPPHLRHYDNAHPPPHHHHHHFSYVSPHCPHHSYLLQQANHSQSCPFFTCRPAPQNTESFASVPSQTHWNLGVSESNQKHNNSLMTQDEIEKPEAEEEEEPVFVLTDEWKEFFAKSEAKRRLAKKQAKK